MSTIQSKLESKYYITDLPFPSKDDPNRVALIQAYSKDQCRLDNEFKNDLIEELGLTGHPKADQLYSLAYEFGHSAGYGEVAYYAECLAVLLK